MGFLDNIFSSFEKSTYRGICRAMIKSYYKVKKQNPDASPRELYALALSLRPTWERKDSSSFTFTKGKIKLTIEKNDRFRDVVRNVIILETMPRGATRNQSFLIDSFREISEAIDEEFKELK